MTEIKEIRQLIGRARIQEAIQKLLQLDTEYNDAIIGFQNRLATLANKELIGIINNDNANMERNSVTHGLLTILTKIEEKKTSESEKEIKVADEKGLEKIIGRNGLQSIEWLKRGIQKANSVCKIHTSDGYVGTGFLVEGGYIFTNNHVIGSASVAQFSQVEFGYDSLDDTPSVFYDLDHKSFETSEVLDYTKVKVKDNHPNVKLATWGKLQINNIPPNKSDALVIIQHPQGRQKELAFSDGTNSIWDHRLHYKVTTEPGSSGSPVFDINWNVVALHHAGGHIPINARGDTKFVNEGILFRYILQDLNKQTSAHAPPLEEVPEKNNTKPIKSILVYNSKDFEYADGLLSHLHTQIRNGNLAVFDIQKDILGDANKEETLSKELEKALIVFILISKNLYKKETINVALNIEQQVSKKKVIPIRVSPFDLNGTPFAELQGLPIGGQSITDFEDIDKTLFEIVRSINRVIMKILEP